MTIGEKIKEARLLKGLTQQELAEKLGYKSRSSINKIEVGGRDIPRSQIVQIANALDVSPAFLMGWEDEKSAPAENGESEKKKDLTSRQERIVKLFDELTEPQQDNIIGRTELLAEQNENDPAEEGAG